MARNKYNVDEELDSPFDAKHFMRMLRYLGSYKKKMFITLILMLTASVASLLGPYLIKIAIDQSIPNKNVTELIVLSAIFLLSLVTTGVCMKYRIRLMAQVGQGVIVDIRSDIFTHLQKLPFTYYDSRPHGKILVRVVNYVNSLSDLLSNGLINLVTDVFSLFVIVIFMLVIDPRLTLVCMATLPLLIIGILTVKNVQRRRWQKVSRKQSNMNAYIHESICGIKVTQSFSREKQNLGIFQDLSGEYKRTWMSAVQVIYLVWPMIENISVWGTSLVYVAGIAWLNKGITVGVLIAFISYVGRFWLPISTIGNFYNSLINTAAYMERIFETIDEKLLVDNLPGAATMPEIQGNVEFNDVVFCYDEGTVVLDHVSFKVNTGDTIALVGPTGAGKTTIVNLISRFYDVTEGEVKVDGMNVRSVTLDSLRKQMGVMLQDTFIFSGTIMDNIRYSRLDATDEEVIAAAKAVKAHDFIASLKDGYQTEVNERGSRLSVGQRQLISFARALLADPRILILDEATSSIDTKTEIALQEGLDRLLAGRTSFIIAHRLSTIKNADKIMYIDNGKIMEQGSHEELMNRRGCYWKLYMAQYSYLEAV